MGLAQMGRYLGGQSQWTTDGPYGLTYGPISGARGGILGEWASKGERDGYVPRMVTVNGESVLARDPRHYPCTAQDTPVNPR